MRPGIAIVGVGETEFRRKHDRSLTSLIVEAGRRAVADAGLTGEDIDGFISPADQPPADEIALGIGARERRYSAINAYTPGAGPVAALIEAQWAIEAGAAKAVLVTYGTKTSAPGGPYAYHAADPLKADLEMPVGYYGQPLYFAALAQRYKYEYGLAPEHLGALAVAQREWAALSPGAQKPERISVADYLAQPMLVDPLRALDCCLITDGACAYVVTSHERAAGLQRKAVHVAGIVAGSTAPTLTEMFTQARDFLGLIAPDTADRAFAQAGVDRTDIDFAQIYDCFTMSILLQLEGLGFCARGEAGRFIAERGTGPGGRFPINTNGGHLSYAYVPGITQIVEAVRQLRGERGEAQIKDAKIGLVSTFGGPDHATLILTRDAR